MLCELYDKNDGCAGFTLIEVMMAIVILSVGMLAIAGMQINAIKGNSQASKITMATALIEEKLDGYKSMPYAAIKDEEGTRDGFLDWKTSVAANTPANGLKSITVSVSWNDGGKPYNISFGTIVSK